MQIFLKSGQEHQEICLLVYSFLGISNSLEKNPDFELLKPEKMSKIAFIEMLIRIKNLDWDMTVLNIPQKAALNQLMFYINKETNKV